MVSPTSEIETHKQWNLNLRQSRRRDLKLVFSSARNELKTNKGNWKRKLKENLPIPIAVAWRNLRHNFDEKSETKICTTAPIAIGLDFPEHFKRALLRLHTHHNPCMFSLSVLPWVCGFLDHGLWFLFFILFMYSKTSIKRIRLLFNW